MSLFGGASSRINRRRESPLIGILAFLVMIVVLYAVALIFAFVVHYAFASSKTTEGIAKPSVQITVNVPAAPKVSETLPTASKSATKATPHKNVAKTAEIVAQLKAQIASLQKQLTDSQSNVKVAQVQNTRLSEQIASLQKQFAIPDGTAWLNGTACVFSRDLTIGDIGDDVACLQRYFQRLPESMFEGTKWPIKLDATGYFNQDTANAVAIWQSHYGMTEDGFGMGSMVTYYHLVSGKG